MYMTTIPRSTASALCVLALLVGSTQVAHATTWNQVGLDDEAVVAIAYDPSVPQTLFAGLDAGGGILRSTDAGVTWTPINTGLTLGGSTSVEAIVVDPTDSDRVVLGLRVASTAVYASTDGGDTWSAADSGFPSGTVDALAMHPATPSILWAGSGDGIHRSTDGGASWSARNADLSDGVCTVICVWDIALHPTLVDTLYLAAPGAEEVYKTTDGGAGWTGTGLGTPSEELALAPTNPDTVYSVSSVGTFRRTTDGGVQWTTLGNDRWDVAHHPGHPSTVVAAMIGIGNGVEISSDAGSSFETFAEGLEGVRIHAITHTGTHVLAATDDGVYLLDGPVFTDGFETGDTTTWSSSVP